MPRNMQDLTLTEDQIHASCIGCAESQPLDHQGSPLIGIFKAFLMVLMSSQVKDHWIWCGSPGPHQVGN